MTSWPDSGTTAAGLVRARTSAGPPAPTSAPARKADRDPLTGLLPRSVWLRRLESAARGDALCAVHLDGLRTGSDPAAGQAGDEVLRALGLLLQRAFRGADSCGRHGGDEVVCLARGMPAEALARRVDLVCHQLQEKPGTAVSGVRMSVGVAAVGTQGPGAALDAAERVLRRVRATGHGGTEIADADDEPAAEVPAVSGVLEAYLDALASADPVAARTVVLDLLDAGSPVDRIVAELLVPAQRRVGELWERGTWSAVDEHAATAVTETALAALTAAAARMHDRRSRHVVVACAEGEWHTLPARMAAVVASTGEARVTVLGPSLPAEHLGRRLAKGDVDLLALSCTVPTNLVGAARCVEAAHEALIPVLVGGRAFGSSPRRAEAIGADAWSEDPLALLGRPPDLAGRSTTVPAEALHLDALDDTAVARAHERVLASFPSLSAMTPSQHERTREDLRWIARFTAATVATGDPSVLDEFLAWLCGLLDGRVPADVLAASAQLLADTFATEAPLGAQLLHEAAGRIEG